MISKVVSRHWFYLILFIIIGSRVLLFSPNIENPHAWRQYDTNQYIDGYYEHGDAFLSPSVCWMGGHKTLLLEFPLPEYLVAQLYKLFGNDLWVARAFFLFFFALSLIYFYKSLKLMLQGFTAEIATLIFALTPLSIFYSTAIHIDFFALAFAFSMLYYCLLGIKRNSFKLLIISMVLGTIAFLVKAPYAFYLALPILGYAYQRGNLKWFIYRSIIYIIPIIAVIAWSSYSQRVNAKIPDWNIIPNFNRFDSMWYWYFGTWQQRLYSANWIILMDRIFTEILGVIGCILLALTFIITSWKNASFKLGLLWFLGTLIYVSVFFNVNVIHNYYQLPLAASLAILVAIGVHTIMLKLSTQKNKIAFGILCAIIFSVQPIIYSSQEYYQEPPLIKTIAEHIEANSNPDDLVIVSYGGLSPQCPLILQPANRFGWSIPIIDLNSTMIYELYKTGKATKLAIVYDGYFEGDIQRFFEAMTNKIGIALNSEGKNLYLCDLSFELQAE